MVGVLWTLAWLALVGLWITAGVVLFILSLGTYGIGVIGLLLLAAWFVYGLTLLGQPFRSLTGRQKAVFVLWVITFNVLALLTSVLFRTRSWAARYRNAGGWAIWMIVLGIVGIYLGGWVWGQAAPYTG